jgi:superfamily II DNA or RNA helicase
MILEIDQNEPSKIRFKSDYEEQLSHIRRFLSFKNKQALFELQKFKNNPWWAKKLRNEDYFERLEELKSKIDICLLMEDEEGYYTYSGLAKDLELRFHCSIINNIKYPEPKLIPWNKSPDKLRYYQKEAIDNLLEIKHGSVSIATGLGKSLCILYIAKALGLKTLIMSPTDNIAKQLLKDFEMFFGKKYVGFYGDGKKKFDKLFTIGIDDSLTKIKPGSEAWEELSKADVFIADESHLTPANTISSICLGLAAKCKYRFFFSATQIRNDGADTLLKGIIGHIVYEMDLKKGVDEGFLAKPIFKMVEVESDAYSGNSDILKAIRTHVLHNPNIYDFVGKMTNKAVEMGEQVLILIDQVDQIPYLESRLLHSRDYAFSGPVPKGLSKTFKKTDPNELVDKFNNGKLKILVGTSCIGLGTNIKPVTTMFLILGGKSEVKFVQAVGRGTRKVNGKESCNIFDFSITNIEEIKRHSDLRESIYNNLYPPVHKIKF